MDLYFERHDGQAVTCEDFVKAMEDANGADLEQFRLWYSQAGTPALTISDEYDADAEAYDLTIAQATAPTPGQETKEPLHIPIEVGLLASDGTALTTGLDGGDTAASRILNLRSAEQTFRFTGVPEKPTPSILREFTAPVTVKIGLSGEQRRRLIAYDADPFTRWESAQQYGTGLLLDMIAAIQTGKEPAIDTAFIDALGDVLLDGALDKALIAETLVLPSEEYLGQQMDQVDVDATHSARELLRRSIGAQLKDAFLAAYHGNASNRPYEPTPAEAGRRRLRNIALSYLGATGDPAMVDLCVEQTRTADNMTDHMGALAVLNDLEGAARGEAMDAFYEKWKDDTLVVDKWFSLQAISTLPGTLKAVSDLLSHPAFSMRTPNKVRALIGAFCMANPLRFHAADGSGYDFLAERVRELDPLNPQVAARLVGAFGQWRRYDDYRQTRMKAALEQIVSTEGLSSDVYEIASKTLGNQ